MRILILILFPVFCFGQPTYVGSTTSPTDNSTASFSPVSIPFPAGILEGDLCIVYVSSRSASATFAVQQDGVQTWTKLSETQSTTATLSGCYFWCRYNGSAGNPSFSMSATTNTSGQMHVFRPTVSTKLWAQTGSQSLSSFAAASPVSVSVATPSFDNTVTLATWNTDDDNTWGSLTGTGWVVTGTAQYRNLAGQDASSSYAHFLQATAGSIVSPDKSQVTLGNDPGLRGAITFYEYTAVSQPRRIYRIN